MSKPRKGKSRSIGKVLHILFEDKKSSRFYVQGYKKDKGYGNNINLQPHLHTDPKSLVNDAKKIKQGNPADEVWVVYDAESEGQRDVNSQHAPAWQNAKDMNINLAISSVSYEFWIFLHYKYSTKFFNESNDLEKYIRENHCAEYDKADVNIYIKLKGRLEEARKNAKKLEQFNITNNSDKKAYTINPYTDFHKLLQAIDDFISNA